MTANGPLRVLIVDDDPDALTLLNTHLVDVGYQVLSAPNARLALQIMLEEGPTMVIADAVMPEMDGLELCRAIRGHEGIPYAYILMLTAQTDESHILAAFDAGADDYLRKPFSPRELLARVRAGSRIVNMQQELERRTREVHRVNAQAEIINDSLADANRQLKILATTDTLTGLLNRREAIARIQDAWFASSRHGQPLSCIAIDIDHFKRFNDTHGHAMGDWVLKHTAQMLLQSARKGESVFRMGGEEFLVLCPQATESMAEVAAERIRRTVEASSITHDGVTVRVTLSAGVAMRSSTTADCEALLRAADEALYIAKSAGRNTVRCANHPLPEPSNKADLKAVPLESALTHSNFGSALDESPRILLVEPGLKQSPQAELLERQGFVVHVADGLASALRRFETATPDVVVFSGVAPTPQWIDGLAQLKAHPSNTGVPIIVASEPGGLGTWLPAGIDDFVAAPAEPMELVLRVANMVRYRRELQRSNAVRGEQTRALDLLLTFSRDVAVAESLDAILEATVMSVASLTCSRRVAVLLPDSAGVSLRPARTVGIDHEAVGRLHVPIGLATAGRVFVTRESIYFNSPAEARCHHGDPDYEMFTGSPSVCTALSAPECTVGVLCISGRPDARPFTESDLGYIDLIGNIAAAAIHECLSRKARDEARDSIVVALAKLAESRDVDTGRHLERVTQFCTVLARCLADNPKYHSVITESFLADLERSVPLHDIGKVAVPDSVLLKNGRLTDGEVAAMRAHAAVGADTIRSVIDRVPGAQFLVMAEQIARSHHEHFDGSGYPQGLRGETIPLAARIAAVADVYDALTNKRVYKDAFDPDHAADLIVAGAGKQFDPDVVEAFSRQRTELKKLACEMADVPERTSPDPDSPRSNRSSATMRHLTAMPNFTCPPVST